VRRDAGALIALALAGLRARRSRTWLAAAGVLAASLVVGTAATVGYGLATGFERAADQADLPDVIARFDDEPRTTLDERVRALPNLAARSYRWERNGVPLWANGHHTHQGAIHLLLGGRHGYEVIAGRDLSGRPGEVVAEQGLARAWDLVVGDTIRVGRAGGLRLVGIASSPDNVAYPLARAARVYLNDVDADAPANIALLWLNDRSKADVTLTQARSVSFGLGRLEFVTREGVRVLLSQAAGIVISLLVAFSLVALVAAGTMLAAGAHADVQRRLGAFGVQRALGFAPARIAALQAVEAAVVALPAATLGIAIGTFAVAGPAGDLLAALNERPPGWALLPPLAIALLAVVAIVVAAATWPAWRAARRPPAEILRGGDRAPRRPRRISARGRPAGRADRSGPAGLSALGARFATGADRSGPAGLSALGARFATAARGRWVAAVATIGVCAGIVTLMLALASLLERLRDDPGTVGKRYQLTVRMDPVDLDAVKAIPGVADAGIRYVVDATDSFRLDKPFRLVAYPGDHTRFEAPPLAAGRRVRAPGEIEVGLALADALGLRPGSTLAAGSEARFRVVGVVRALESNGRIAWTQPDRLGDVTPSVVVRLDGGADRRAVERALFAVGGVPQAVGGATTRNAAFLGVLAAVLRGVGITVALVCLYALVQALAVTARERRGAVAMLRACGGDGATVALVLMGAAAAVAIPGALVGVTLEVTVLGPLVARLAAGFATLPIAPGAGQVVLVVAGLVALAAVATALVARRVLREPVVLGLREE
jgi:hypothetical protein